MNATLLIRFALLLLLLPLGCQLNGQDSGRDRQLVSATLSVVGTNDLHGGIVERAGAGGLALFGGYLSNLREARARDGGAVLLIDAGDMWQGTLESNLPEGAPVVAAYNVLRYDAVAIGNHEFDFGPTGPAAMARTDSENPRGALQARASEAEFPFLAANLVDAATSLPVSWHNVKPSQQMSVAGIKVGVIGVTSANTLRTTLSENVKGLRIANLAQSIEAEAKTLRSVGVALVIVTAHAGGDCKEFDNPLDLSSCDPDSEIFAAARALPAGLVDLIIGGHVHKGMAHEVNGIAIISSWSGGRFFGRVDFQLADGEVIGHHISPPTRICRFVDVESSRCRASVDDKQAVVASYEGRVVRPDTRIAKVLAPAITAAAAMKNERLGPSLATAFRRRPDPESPLANLFTDIMLASEPNADVAIHNTLGGIRADLPAGALTYGSVYEMFPFDNRIVHLTLSGAELRAVLANQIEGPVRRAQVSGIRVRAACDKSALALAMYDRSGREIDDDAQLLVVTNDFLITGGDGIFTPAMLARGFPVENDGPLVRDIIVDWMRNTGGQLHERQFIDDNNPRWIFPGPAPVRCKTSAS